MRLLDFWFQHAGELVGMLGQHVFLVAASSAIAAAIGIPLGVLAARRPRFGAPLIGAANVIETVPSLALFGFLLPLPLIGGVGARTAVVALVLYGLLPVIRMTAAGLGAIDQSVLEAALAMGMTPRQRLWLVELPLALPAIVAGLRVVTVIGVGTATIAAAIGAGGLGEYIFRGLSMVDPIVILAGAVPAAALALFADGMLGLLERSLGSRRRARRRIGLASVAAGLLVTLALLAGSARTRGGLVVGSKNFTEQIVLGEMMAQAIEQGTGLRVRRRLNLGGTAICDRALSSGEIDVYVEYTGTALTALFHQPVGHDRTSVFARVREAYARTGRTLLSPLGYDNTFAILIRGQAARALGLRRISDLRPYVGSWRAGFGYEFMERADGFRGLTRSYGLEFGTAPRVMDLALSYRALAAGEVDVIAGNATDGLIDALDLSMLEDDRHYFPPYDAAPVVGTRALLHEPTLRPALERFAHRISAQDMRRLTGAVDRGHRDVPEVVREFLRELESRR